MSGINSTARTGKYVCPAIRRQREAQLSQNADSQSQIVEQPPYNVADTNDKHLQHMLKQILKTENLKALKIDTLCSEPETCAKTMCFYNHLIPADVRFKNNMAMLVRNSNIVRPLPNQREQQQQ